MRIIGLTGSIGMGKSTTADMFRERHIPVFCADQAVHELYTKDQELIGQMASMFENITNADGINRQKLSEHLRKDPKRLRDVERLVHPRVRRMREEYVEIWQNEGRPLCVFDIPLFFETGAKHEVDLVMVCSAPRIIQFERVMARPGMTLQNFLMILGRQMPDAEKRRHADLVVMTDLGMDHARQRLHACIETLDDGHA